MIQPASEQSLDYIRSLLADQGVTLPPVESVADWEGVSRLVDWAFQSNQPFSGIPQSLTEETIMRQWVQRQYQQTLAQQVKQLKKAQAQAQFQEDMGAMMSTREEPMPEATDDAAEVLINPYENYANTTEETEPKVTDMPIFDDGDDLNDEVAEEIIMTDEPSADAWQTDDSEFTEDPWDTGGLSLFDDTASESDTLSEMSRPPSDARHQVDDLDLDTASKPMRESPFADETGDVTGSFGDTVHESQGMSTLSEPLTDEDNPTASDGKQPSDRDGTPSDTDKPQPPVNEDIMDILTKRLFTRRGNKG